jgi:hypothetical protein
MICEVPQRYPFWPRGLDIVVSRTHDRKAGSLRHDARDGNETISLRLVLDEGGLGIVSLAL